MEQYDTYSGETWGSVTYPFYGNLSTVSDRYVNTERLGREGFSWEQVIVMLSAPICHNIPIYPPTKKYPSSLVWCYSSSIFNGRVTCKVLSRLDLPQPAEWAKPQPVPSGPPVCRSQHLHLTAGHVGLPQRNLEFPYRPDTSPRGRGVGAGCPQEVERDARLAELCQSPFTFRQVVP